MTYSLLGDLTESRMFPSKKSLDKEDFESLSETAFLLIMALRILLTEDSHLARRYVKKTISASNFNKWRADGNDLYIALHALSNGEYEDEKDRPEKISTISALRWLREMQASDGRDDMETKRFFIRLERLLFISDSSMKAIRRLVMDWDDITHNQKRLAATRLLQMLRSRAPKSDLLTPLSLTSRARNWEIVDACNVEDGEDCGGPLNKGGYHHPLKKDSGPSGFASWAAGTAIGAVAGYMLTRKKVKESECGTTTSSSVASVVAPLGAIGPGFAGSDGDKGIYQGVPMIRRGTAPKKK